MTPNWVKILDDLEVTSLNFWRPSYWILISKNPYFYISKFSLSHLVHMVEIDQELVMDSKGRILIPLEIRKLLHFESGEKFLFTLENGKLILLKSSDYDEFQQELKKFQQEVQKIQNTPITTEKLY